MGRQHSANRSRRYTQRKSAPKVIDGRTQRKNRSRPTRTAPLIRREQPGAGHRHYLRKNDILKFIDILPDWNEISEGLHEIILAKAEEDTDGWFRPGQVAICACECELVYCVDVEHVQEHAALYRRLGIQYTRDSDEKGPYYLVEYSPSSRRAFQLLHVFLHELGHHHDWMTSDSSVGADRGESYAEQYAYKNEAVIFDRYVEAFGL